MKKILLLLFILFLLLVVLFVIKTGVERHEKAECLKFQTQALEFPDFYLTEYEKQQCDAYGIEVNAPVKKLPRM